MATSGGTAGTSKFVKRLKRKVPRPACCEGAQKINVDDQHGNNVLSLRRHRFGRKVNSSDRRVFHEPSLDIAKASQMEHYFSIGNKAHAPSDQIEIILNVTGEKGWSSLGEKMRRQDHWRTALTGGDTDGDRHYRIIDLPKLALQFSEFWETDVSEYDDIDDIPQSVVDKIQQEIVSLLQYSSVLPPAEDCSLLRQSSRRLQGLDEEEDNEESTRPVEEAPKKRRRRRSREPPQSVIEDEEEVETEEDSRLRMFDYRVLEKEWFTDGKYLEVGRKEIMLEGATNDLPLFLVNQTIRALGGDPYLPAKYEKVVARGKQDKGLLTCYGYNFQRLKEKITKDTPGAHGISCCLRSHVRSFYSSGNSRFG